MTLLLVALVVALVSMGVGVLLGAALGYRKGVGQATSRLALDSSLTVACPACGGKFLPWKKPDYDGNGWYAQTRACEDCGRHQRRRYKGEREGK